MSWSAKTICSDLRGMQEEDKTLKTQKFLHRIIRWVSKVKSFLFSLGIIIGFLTNKLRLNERENVASIYDDFYDMVTNIFNARNSWLSYLVFGSCGVKENNLVKYDL